MPVTGPQLDRIHQILKQAFNRSEMRRLVRSCLDDSFDANSTEQGYDDQLWDFLEWANRQDRVLEIIKCAYNQRPNRLDVKALHDEFNPGLDVKEGAVQQQSPTRHDVVIAYIDEHKAFMRSLRQSLMDGGIAVWEPPKGFGTSTAEWQNAAQDAITAASCVVIILSPLCRQSSLILSTIEYARACSVHILPVLIDGEKIKSVPLSIFDHPCVDLRSKNEKAVKDILIPEIKEHIELKAPPAAAVQPPPPAPLAVPPTPAQLGIEWIRIPAGEFLMGSGEQDSMALDDEKPQHVRFTGEFLISKYPITNQQYQRFVRGKPHAQPKHFERGKVTKSRKRHPVTNISYFDAVAFCEWIGVRLPTEEEWEKAARGVDGRIWPWNDGSLPEEQCNCDNRARGTTPVDKYPNGASPFGVMDMAGNVYEWTSSIYAYKLTEADSQTDDRAHHETPLEVESVGVAAAENKLGDSQSIPINMLVSKLVGKSSPFYDFDEDEEEEQEQRGQDADAPVGDANKEYSILEVTDNPARVLRGGSWLTSAKFVRCAARYSAKPSDAESWWGFRVAMSIGSD